MDSVFKEWKESLSALHSSIGQELEELHRCKTEVERLKDDMIAAQSFGKFIYDDKRIVLSAPEIIIGNVGPSGVLREGASTVVVRGNTLSLEGANNGSVTTRASQIQQIAEDPGIDGNEHVVSDTSSIVNMARNVVLHASDAQGTFYESPLSFGSGVQIHSDTDLTINAAVPNAKRAATIEEYTKSLKANKEDQKKRMDELEVATKTIMQNIDKLFEKSEKLSGDEVALRTNGTDLSDLHEEFKNLALALAQTSSDYIAQMSILAETERQIADLDKEKTRNNEAKSTYKEGNTGASLSLSAQNIDITSVDGDGIIRKDGVISMKANSVSIDAVDSQNGLMKDSGFLVNVENVMLDTRNVKLDEKSENGDVTTIGTVSIMAKDFSVTALDAEIKDGQMTEKALVKDSSITLRAEKMKAETTDTEGKVTGSIELNTKAMEIKAVDVDKEKRTDMDMAAGSSITVFAEKMSLGSKDKEKNKAKQLQVTGDKIAVLGKETTEIQQGEAKAVVQLDGGNLKMSGAATEIYGKTTLQADTQINGALKVPKATIDNLEAKSSFKSSNSSDGMATPTAASSASLSAKLKEEEIKQS